MELGDERAGGLEAADAARAEAEAAAEAVLGAPQPDVPDHPGADATDGTDAPTGIEAPTGSEQGAPSPSAASSPVCPFLRLQRDGGTSAPGGVPDVDHRCTALAAPVPVSDAQQSLVCLVASHVDCPRYLRGSHVVPVLEPVSARRSIPRPTLAAAAVLALSLALTLAYTAANGGLVIPIASPTPPASAAIVTMPPASAVPPTPSPAATVVPSATPPSPGGSPAPSSPPPTASPVLPGPTTGGATADRLALLQPCPDRPDCYVYTVRVGDNLTSIGLYFGVPFDTILGLNPWIRDPSTIRKGDRITLPTPTR